MAGRPPSFQSFEGNNNNPKPNSDTSTARSLSRSAYDASTPDVYKNFDGPKSQTGSASESNLYYDYTVAKGDTLYSISVNQLINSGYGQPTQGEISAEEKAIILANQETYPSLACNPNLIQPGVVLKIPTGDNQQNSGDCSATQASSQTTVDQPPVEQPNQQSYNQTESASPPVQQNYAPAEAPQQPPQQAPAPMTTDQFWKEADYSAYKQAQINTYSRYWGNQMPMQQPGFSMYGYQGNGGWGGIAPYTTLSPFAAYGGGMMGGYPGMMGGYGGMMGGYPGMMGGYGGYGGYGMNMNGYGQMTQTFGPAGMTSGYSPMYAPSPGVMGFAGNVGALTSAFMPILNLGSALALDFKGIGNPMMNMMGVMGGGFF